MRIVTGWILMLALCGLLAACNDMGGSSPKMAVVDLNRLMRESEPGKAGLKFIETQQTELQSKLDEIQDRLEKNPSDEKAVQELQRVYATSQQRIQAEGQNVVGQLFDAIQKTLNAYREKNGYAMLIRTEALDSYDPGLDVTGAVMVEVNKLQLDFKPLPDAEPDKVTDAPAPSEKAAPKK